MTTKVKYDELKDLSGAAILDKLQSEEIKVPEIEEDDFLKFAGLEKGSQERIDFINERKSPDDPPLVPPALKVEPGDELPPASPPEPQEPKTDDGIVDPPNPDEPGAPAPALDDSKISYEELMAQVAEKDESLKKQRNSASEQGRLRKAAEDRIKELEDTAKEQAKEKKPEGVKPARPKRPKTSDFDGDRFDEGYLNALDQYDSALDTYETSLEEYQKSNEPEYVKKLRDRLDEVSTKTDNAFSYAQTEKKSIEQKKYDDGWNGVWENAGKIQKQLGISTSVDAKAINTFQLKVLNKDSVDGAGNALYTPKEIAEADRYMDNLSKEDKENYAKTVKIVNKFYKFDEGQPPQKRYEDLEDADVIRSIVKKNGIGIDSVKLVNLTKAEEADLLAKKQQDNNNHVSGMNGSDIGNGDPKLTDEKTSTEKMQALEGMAETAQGNPGLIQVGNPRYDKEFADKFNKLRKDLYP